MTVLGCKTFSQYLNYTPQWSRFEGEQHPDVLCLCARLCGGLGQSKCARLPITPSSNNSYMWLLICTTCRQPGGQLFSWEGTLLTLHIYQIPIINHLSSSYLESEPTNVQAEHVSHPDSCLFPGPFEGPNPYTVSEAVVNLLGAALCLPVNA